MTPEERSAEELAAQLAIIAALEKERDRSDKLYAVKLVEIVVWGLIALFAGALVTSIVIAVMK